MTLQQGELIQRTSGELMTEKAKRLQDEKERFKRGFREQVLALHTIHEQELFRLVPGCESVADYAFAELGIGRSAAYQLLDAAAFFLEGERSMSQSTIVDSVTNIEQIRGLAGMKAENKVRVIAAAVKESDRTGAPLTGKLVQQVARERFNWKTRKEFQDSKRTPAMVQADEFKAFSDKAERLMGALVGLGRPTELVETYGPPQAWSVYYAALIEWVEELKEIA